MDEEQLKREIDARVDRGEHDQALVLERRLMREFHTSYKLMRILRHVKLDEASLIQEDTGDSLALLGFALDMGREGSSKTPSVAARCTTTKVLVRSLMVESSFLFLVCLTTVSSWLS